MKRDSCTSKAADKFMDYFREAEALHWQEFERPLPLYKATSKASVTKVFRRLLGSDLTGVAYAAELVHLPILAQCLGNANHRTTELFAMAVLEWAGVRVPHDRDRPGYQERYTDYTNRWHVASKQVIAEHDSVAPSTRRTCRPRKPSTAPARPRGSKNSWAALSPRS